MAKALGTTLEEEHRSGLHKLAKVSLVPAYAYLMNCISDTSWDQQIKGQVGLFFTDTEPQEVIEWFADFQQPDFARTGNFATRTIILPAGPVMRHHSDPPEPFPHNEEPQLRKLGLTTSMNKGVPILHSPHKLCEKGNPITSEQAQLLKLIGEKMVIFRVGLIARWDADSGEVVQIEGAGMSPEVNAGTSDDEDQMTE